MYLSQTQLQQDLLTWYLSWVYPQRLSSATQQAPSKKTAIPTDMEFDFRQASAAGTHTVSPADYLSTRCLSVIRRRSSRPPPATARASSCRRTAPLATPCLEARTGWACRRPGCPRRRRRWARTWASRPRSGRTTRTACAQSRRRRGMRRRSRRRCDPMLLPGVAVTAENCGVVIDMFHRRQDIRAFDSRFKDCTRKCCNAHFAGGRQGSHAGVPVW